MGPEAQRHRGFGTRIALRRHIKQRTSPETLENCPMNATEFCANCWPMCGLQLLGLTTALFARLSEGHHYQESSQRLFLLALTLIGGAAIVSVQMQTSWWVISAFTLSLMVLTVTCDFRRCGRAVG